MKMVASHSSPKADYITVLAIYDDPPSKHKPNGFDVQPTSKLSIPISGSSKASGGNGHTTANGNVVQTAFGATAGTSNKSPSILRNSDHKILHKNDCHSVHFEGKTHNSANARLANSYHSAEKWSGNSRKSRIASSFLDAQESIEFELNEKWPNFDRTLYQLQRIVLSSDTQELPLGLEVSPVPNQSSPSRLLAVEVRSVEEKGRIADDGRLRVGDQLVEIDEMRCDQISFARVQLRLRELQSVPTPSFAFFRRISQIKSVPKLPQRLLPVTTALQIGNTSQIGETKIVVLQKADDGFGFTYAGRESFANDRKENLFYVKGLRKDCSGIAIGDRILKIDQMPLAEMSQSEVTSLLKGKSVGQSVELLISRNVEDLPPKQQTNGNNGKEAATNTDTEQKHPFDCIFDSLKAHFLDQPDLELHCLDIPLNDTPGAGLGLSLKAQRVGATDSGLFVRSLLHGSAAFKDGRLQVNDRLVGIEDQNLLNYELNGEALEAFMRTISQMPQTKRSIRLFVSRKVQPSLDSSKPYGSAAGTRRGSDSDLSQLSNFDREAPSRRSISEKRPFVAHNDPSHLKTYQRIVHQRQISAPALSSTTVANASRSRRSLYDEFRRVRSAHAGPSAKKQRPKTMFYVDESGTAVTSETMGFASTFPSNTVRTVTNNDNNNAQIMSKNEMWNSENERRAMPSSTSHPLALSEFSKSVTINKKSCGQCQDESESKHTKCRRSSLGNGLFKLFGRGSTSHKEKDTCREGEAAARSHRPPPPAYQQRLSPTVQHFHRQPCQCFSSIDQCCPAPQCSHINPGPMVNLGLRHRTNNCTQLHHFYRSSFHPPSPQDGSFDTSQTDHHHRLPFHSLHFGLAEVPHLQNGTTNSTLCQQQWPYPMHCQDMRQSQRRHNAPPLQPSQLAWTTITRSTPGSLPGRVQHGFSDVSDNIRCPPRHHQQHQPLHRSRTVVKHKPKPPSAVFYDYDDQCSDWVIRC